jgi:AraC-like DNA-binding protein
MDPLSDILTMLAVDRAIPIRFESRGVYAMRFGSYEHLKFGAVLLGHVYLWVDGEPAPIRLEAGDCYLLTDGRAYRTFNAEGIQEVDGTAFFKANRDANGVVRLGDGPPDKVVIGGRFTFDPEGAMWLREALPPMIRITADMAEAAPLRATLALFSDEANRGALGETVIIDRLADILLVQAIRAHIAAAPPERANWLAGFADPRIGRALRRLHADVAADWTVASLADAAGMSRSSFAHHFRNRVGLSPLDYLTRWRMYRVRRALIETNLAFTTIAERNGYQSRTSCSLSFKRIYGYPPSELRMEQKMDTGLQRAAGDPASGDMGAIDAPTRL